MTGHLAGVSIPSACCDLSQLHIIPDGALEIEAVFAVCLDNVMQKTTPCFHDS